MKNFFIVAFLLFVATQIVSAKSHIEVLNIYDGDTIQAKISKEKFVIRLKGIDCWESQENNHAYKQAKEKDTPLEKILENGLISKKFLKDLYKITPKNKIFFEFQGIDKYSRALGIVYFNKINVNKEMIKNGGCWAYDYNK